MRLIDVKQYSNEWWSARKGVPTASAFDRILTPTGKPSKQWYDYACELISELCFPDLGAPPSFVSPAMQNGTTLEPEARRFYSMERDIDVAEVGLMMDDIGHFGASPDAVAGTGLLECKCPLPKTHIGYLLDGVLPADYKPQCHGQLVVSGAEFVDFLSYVPKMPPLLVRVVPDQYTIQLRMALDEFWDKFQEMLGKYREVEAIMREGTARHAVMV